MFYETSHIVFLVEWFVLFPDNPAVAAILFIIVLILSLAFSTRCCHLSDYSSQANKNVIQKCTFLGGTFEENFKNTKWATR